MTIQFYRSRPPHTVPIQSLSLSQTNAMWPYFILSLSFLFSHHYWDRSRNKNEEEKVKRKIQHTMHNNHRTEAQQANMT